MTKSLDGIQMKAQIEVAENSDFETKQVWK